MRNQTPRPPFQQGSLRALQMLGLFLSCADEATDARRYLMRTRRLDRSRGHLRYVPIAARTDASLAWALDGALAVIVGPRVEPFAEATASELAIRWLESGPRLEGLDLVALIWWIARDDRIALRPLEQKIARHVHPARLLSSVQRAALFGPWSLPGTR